MSTETIEQTDTDVVPFEDDGEGDFAHIVNTPGNDSIWQPGMTAQDVVDIARVTQQPVIALCKKVFVPKRNPENLPACQPCIDRAGELMRAAGE